METPPLKVEPVALAIAKLPVLVSSSNKVTLNNIKTCLDGLIEVYTRVNGCEEIGTLALVNSDTFNSYDLIFISVTHQVYELSKVENTNYLVLSCNKEGLTF